MDLLFYAIHIVKLAFFLRCWFFLGRSGFFSWLSGSFFSGRLLRRAFLRSWFSGSFFRRFIFRSHYSLRKIGQFCATISDIFQFLPSSKNWNLSRFNLELLLWILRIDTVTSLSLTTLESAETYQRNSFTFGQRACQRVKKRCDGVLYI